MANNDNRPKPPTAPSVSTANTEVVPPKPDRGTVAVPGGFAKQGVDDNKNDTDYIQPDRNIKGIAPAVSDVEDQLSALLGADAIKRLIDAGVRQVLDQMNIQPSSGPQKFINSDQQNAPSAPAFNFLKHYRNDVSPEIEVQELDMSTDEPQLNPIRGSFIRFRRGHFFAASENQVKQLDWMMNAPASSADGMRTIGGNPAIYEDDGEKLYYCTAGCPASEFVSASEKKYKAHMRAVHGVNA